MHRIVKGEFIVDVSINDHSAVGNYQDAIKLAYDMADMEIELNEKYLFRFYQILANPARQGIPKDKSDPCDAGLCTAASW